MPALIDVDNKGRIDHFLGAMKNKTKKSQAIAKSVIPYIWNETDETHTILSIKNRYEKFAVYYIPQGEKTNVIGDGGRSVERWGPFSAAFQLCSEIVGHDNSAQLESEKRRTIVVEDGTLLEVQGKLCKVELYDGGRSAEIVIMRSDYDVEIIPTPPSFFGPGWMDELDSWTKENLPHDFSAKWEDEAAIRANTVGGSPSSHYCAELRSAVAAYNFGKEYKTPRSDWNAEQIAQDKQIRERM